MRRFTIALLGFFPWLVNAQINPSRIWTEFRSVYPYHVQTTALSSPDDRGTRALIVSEPPPGATLEGIGASLGVPLTEANVCRHRFGYDGWVKDVVVTLPPMPDRDLREQMDQLHEYLYGTTYKTDAISLPTALRRPSNISLDLRVTSADTYRWLVSGKIMFRGFTDSESSTVTTLLQRKKEGVYLSDRPGAVLWVLPRSGSYAQFRREARQFAIDSDLIIGGVANATHLAILARERVLPVDVMPPLRAETIFQLAGVRTDSLSQSYDRNYILAGKYDGAQDWAPIYLSNELIDTEYGSLLNLTDQLLKSWSMNGKIEYANFDYPRPGTWPFAQPLALMPDVKELLKKGDEGLTFNWNTKGAGYVDNISGLRVYALNRTGALPVSYLSGGTNNTEHEKNAYDWFANTTTDPNLARVVQYAALYQFFREFRIFAPRDRSSVPDKQPKTGALAAEVADALSAMKASDCERGTGKYTSLLVKAPEYCGKLNVLAQEFGAPALRAVASYLVSNRDTSVEKMLDTLFARPESERGSFLDSLEPKQRLRYTAAIDSRLLARDGDFRVDLVRRVRRVRARDLYAEAAAKRPEEGWIRTASVVVSQAMGELAFGTGGHNLDARITRFAEDPLLKPGEIRVERIGQDRVIRYSVGDRARIPDWLHASAVERNDTALLQKVKSTFRMPVSVPANRSLEEAIHFPVLNARSGRGLVPDIAKPGAFDAPGWGHGVEPTALEHALLDSAKSSLARVLSVQMNGDFYRILDGQTGRMYQARSYTDAMDAVVASLKRAPSPPPSRLVLAGFDDAEAVSFRRTAQNWMAREGLPGKRLVGVRTVEEASAKRSLAGSFRRIATEGDLSRATFGEWKMRDIRLRNGELRTVYEASIEVPARMNGLQRLWFRFKVFFSRFRPPAAEMAGLEPEIRSAMAALGRDATANDAAAAVETLLRGKYGDRLDSVILETTDWATAELHTPILLISPEVADEAAPAQ